MPGRRTWTRPASIGVLAAVYLAAGTAGFLVAEALSETNTLIAGLGADLTATVLVFAASVALDNTSVYDPYWSVAPFFLALWWAGQGEGSAVRTWLVLIVLGLWGARLTFNFLRGWTGLGHEDWRYTEYRRFGTARYWAISFGGLQLVPTLVVFGALLPIHAALTGPSAGFGIFDAAAVAVALSALTLETAADRQKHRFVTSGTAGGILDTGVWRPIRHPNYLGEIGFWWGIFGFGAAVGAAYLWTGVGAVAMTALFWFISVPLMDRHMLERRPEYREVLERVPALLPRLRISRPTSRT